MLIGGVPIKKDAQFKLVREDWSKYEVLDGDAIVWLRSILQKLFEVDMAQLSPETVLPGASSGYVAAAQAIVTAFYLKADLKGEPNPNAISSEDLSRATFQEMDFHPYDEPFNEYLVEGPVSRVVRIKAVATRMRLYPKLWNSWGDPVVQVDSQNVFGPPRDAQPQDLR